jgi:ATP-dependent RNA helicase DDX19/DBP5
VLHGGLDVQQRKDTISLFKNAKTKVLITTNVLSRGIDISQVTHVINYDLPEEHDTKEPDYATYLHRIGRTARFGRKGIAVNFIAGPKDAQNMKKIINYFKTNVEKVERSDIANKLKL